jgi:hypothetical protein
MEKIFPRAQSTGLVCNKVIGVDIDLLHKEAADAAEEAIRDWFRDKQLLVRYGLAPKRLFLFRATEPFSKFVVTFFAPESAGLEIRNGCQKGGPRLEVLGQGSQFVAFGTHENTGEPYRWPDESPLDIKIEDLPEIGEADAHALIEYLVEMLREKFGYELASGDVGGDKGFDFTETPSQEERFEQTEYGGAFGINQLILEFPMREHDQGVACEGVIKELRQKVHDAWAKLPDDHPEKKDWDWDRQNRQIDDSVYGDIKRRCRERPSLIDQLPETLRTTWYEIEKRGGVPELHKKRGMGRGAWAVHDTGPAEEIPDADSPPKPEAETGKRKYRFQIVDFEDMNPDEVSHYLVDELFPEKGSECCGANQSASKAFYARCMLPHRPQLDLSRAVKGGLVVYCAFEGGYGYKKRVAALRKHYKIEGETNGATQLKIVPSSAPNLVKDHTLLVREIKEQLGNVCPVLVVLDTLNKSLPGSESKDVDMAAYIRAAESIRNAFDCLVIIVHRCGWDESRPRGHSSLPGAVDVQIQVTREGDAVTVEVELMRSTSSPKKSWWPKIGQPEKPLRPLYWSRPKLRSKSAKAEGPILPHLFLRKP